MFFFILTDSLSASCFAEIRLLLLMHSLTHTSRLIASAVPKAVRQPFPRPLVLLRCRFPTTSKEIQCSFFGDSNSPSAPAPMWSSASSRIPSCRRVRQEMAPALRGDMRERWSPAGRRNPCQAVSLRGREGDGHRNL